MEGHASPRISAFNCPNCGAAVSPDDIVCAYCGSSLATRICGACFRAVGIREKHCSHCGANVQDAQSVNTERALKCPRCDNELELQKTGGQLIHTCQQCGGMWLNGQSFQNICDNEAEHETVLCHISQALTPQTIEKSRKAYIPCPECGKLMNQKNFAGCSSIILDSCREHGIWFDRQELHRIVAFIREGGMRRSRQKEIRDLQEMRDLQRMKAITANPNDYLELNPCKKQESDLVLMFANWLRSR